MTQPTAKAVNTNDSVHSNKIFKSQVASALLGSYCTSPLNIFLSTVNRWAWGGDGNEVKGSKEVHLQLFGWHSACMFKSLDHNVLIGTSEEVQHQRFRRCRLLGLYQKKYTYTCMRRRQHTCYYCERKKSCSWIAFPLSWMVNLNSEAKRFKFQSHKTNHRWKFPQWLSMPVHVCTFDLNVTRDSCELCSFAFLENAFSNKSALINFKQIIV